MIYEYAIFNIIIISAPLILGCLKPFYFLKHWLQVLVSVLLVGVPYLIWDSLVAGWHWKFNYHYILGIELFNLPVEEILFFMTVPAACLFTWEMLIRRLDNQSIPLLKTIRPVFYLLPVLGIIIFLHGQQYTGLAIIFMGLAILSDRFLKTHLFLQKRFTIYFILVIFFTLIFNGYLTWRPVVVYNEIYKTGLKIFTIPLEDFGFGFSLIYLNTVVYEKLKLLKIFAADHSTGTIMNQPM